MSSAFGFQPSEKLRVAGLDNMVERSLFWPMSFVCVALSVVGLWHSSAVAPRDTSISVQDLDFEI